MSTNNTSNDDFIQIDYTGKQINDAIDDVINVLPNKADSSSVHSIPAGGTTGQVLKKTSNSDYQVAWQDDSGGGGGTSDYSDLTNKPKINNVELSGNKSLSDLGINIPTKTSDLTNDSGFLTTANFSDFSAQDIADLWDEVET